MAGSSNERFSTSSEGALNIGNIKVEENLDMQEEEEEEMNVKKEKGIGSEEEECIDIKDEEGIYSEVKEEFEDIVTTEEDVDIKEEVS
jgi:hypothetical protein